MYLEQMKFDIRELRRTLTGCFSLPRNVWRRQQAQLVYAVDQLYFPLEQWNNPFQHWLVLH